MSHPDPDTRPVGSSPQGEPTREAGRQTSGVRPPAPDFPEIHTGRIAERQAVLVFIRRKADRYRRAPGAASEAGRVMPGCMAAIAAILDSLSTEIDAESHLHVRE